MNWKQVINPILTAVLCAVLVLGGVNLYVVPQLLEGQTEARGGGITRFNSPIQIQSGATVANGLTSDTLAVSGASTLTGAVSAGALSPSSLSVSGATTLTGTSALVGVTTFSANPILASQSITPTDGGILTPTLSLVTLTPAGALGTAMGACTTGQVTTLYNSVNANVVITDTGNFIGAGNATLGQFDALELVCIDSKWVQASAVIAN